MPTRVRNIPPPIITSARIRRASRRRISPGLVDSLFWLFGPRGADALNSLDEYLTVRIRSHHTRYTYSRLLAHFLNWLKENSIPVAKADADALNRHLDQQARTAVVRKAANAAVRGYFALLRERGICADHPLADESEVRPGRAATLAQVARLVASIDPKTPAGKRDLAIFGVILYAGVSAGAIARLTVSDWSPDGMQLRFRDGRSQTRHFSVPDGLRDLLAAYVALTPQRSLWPEAPFFRGLSQDCDSFTELALTQAKVWQMMNRRVQKAGLKSRFTAGQLHAGPVPALLHSGIHLLDLPQVAAQTAKEPNSRSRYPGK